MIQVREEKKEFKNLDITEGLGISLRELKQLVGDGLLPVSFHSGKIYPSELIDGIRNWKSLNSITCHIENNQYWNELKNCSILHVDNGVFLVDSPVEESVKKEFTSIVSNYGVWRAQGINNHVHMMDVTSNKVSQVLLAYELIGLWDSLLTNLDLSDKCTIYLNGKRDTTICIYFIDGITEQKLRNFDTELKIKNINIFTR